MVSYPGFCKENIGSQEDIEALRTQYFTKLIVTNHAFAA
uniref:Uncharacterized protein n=1 Tax=Arundo donax TaxID=35708 RepID=A0A0A9API5_ARUDO